jgi:hypothetical protein
MSPKNLIDNSQKCGFTHGLRSPPPHPGVKNREVNPPNNWGGKKIIAIKRRKFRIKRSTDPNDPLLAQNSSQQ